MKKSELRQLIKEELLKEKNTERNDDALRYAMDKDLVKSVGEFVNKWTPSTLVYEIEKGFEYGNISSSYKKSFVKSVISHFKKL